MKAKRENLSSVYKFVTIIKGLHHYGDVAEYFHIDTKTERKFRQGKDLREDVLMHVLATLFNDIDALYLDDLDSNGGKNAVSYLRMERTILKCILDCEMG